MFPSNGDVRLCLSGSFLAKAIGTPFLAPCRAFSGGESRFKAQRGSLGTAVPGGGGDETKWNMVKPIKRPTLFFLYLWAVWGIFFITPKDGMLSQSLSLRPLGADH